MTPNEKLVWAAAFAADFREHKDAARATFAAWVTVAAMRSDQASECAGQYARDMLEEMRRDA